MTDFFDDLERELRRAHRRDTERHAVSRLFDRRRLPRLPAAGLRTLVALAVVVAIVTGGVVLAVGRESGVERPAAPQPGPTTAPGAQGGCVPSKWWKAPIVDEPIPEAIASRFAIFRDPPPSGALPRDLPSFPEAKKLYRGAVTLRPRLDTGARLRVVLIAADMAGGDYYPNNCAPPPDPLVPGICVAVFLPDGTRPEGTWLHSPRRRAVAGTAPCYSYGNIESAQAWFGVTGQTIFGLAPDGVDRATFGTPTGTQSLNITQNVFAGEMRYAQQHPQGVDPGFAP